MKEPGKLAGVTEQLAAVLDDPRDADRTTHAYLEMIHMRAYGILADYSG